MPASAGILIAEQCAQCRLAIDDAAQGELRPTRPVEVLQWWLAKNEGFLRVEQTATRRQNFFQCFEGKGVAGAVVVRDRFRRNGRYNPAAQVVRVDLARQGGSAELPRQNLRPTERGQGCGDSGKGGAVKRFGLLEQCRGPLGRKLSIEHCRELPGPGGQDLMRRTKVVFQQRRRLIPTGPEHVETLQRTQPLDELFRLCDTAQVCLLRKHVEVCGHDVEGFVLLQKCADVREHGLPRQPSADPGLRSKCGGRVLPLHARGQCFGISRGRHRQPVRRAVGVGQVEPLVRSQCSQWEQRPRALVAELRPPLKCVRKRNMTARQCAEAQGARYPASIAIEAGNRGDLVVQIRVVGAQLTDCGGNDPLLI